MIDAPLFVQQLNRDLDTFSKTLGSQYHLKIPAGVIQKVDFYRDSYFPYLKDSVFKSNICYLLQQIDYQLWQYRLFRPGLSLENSFFYQLLISLGIVAEALVTAILLNPLVEPDERDRSLGHIAEKHKALHTALLQNTFSKNIELLGKLQVLPDNLLADLQVIRKDIRNQVHIQNWEGRLYSTLKYSDFRQKLDYFRHFLIGLKENIRLDFQIHDLLQQVFDGLDPSALFRGQVSQYIAARGYGFIQTDDSGPSVFFHISQVLPGFETEISEGVRLEFHLENGQKGWQAVEIRPAAAPQRAG